MSVSVVVCHTFKAHFFSSTTLGIAVYFHSLQTKVCPLCVGVVLGTSINIAICCILRPPFLLGTTLCMSSVITTLRPESVCCVPGLWVSLARPSALSSVFAALKLKSIHYVLRYALSYNLRHHYLLPPKDLLCA